MCGIAGIYFVKKNHGYSKFTINKFVDGLLKGIEDRGRHATGVVSVGWRGQKLLLEKEPIEATKFVKKRTPIEPEQSRIILLHTRYATKGEPSQNENNHPVRYRGVYTTHNGVIHNDDELFKSEELKRYAEVDSEIIPALLHKYGFGDADKAFEKLRGGFATATIRPGVNPDELILAKGGGYPLCVHVNDTFIVWASTIATIENAWASVFKSEGKPKIDAEWIPSGTLWKIKGSNIEKKRFTYHEPVKRSSSTSYQSYQGSSYPSAGGRWNGGGMGSSLYQVTSHLRGRFKEQVNEFRAAGQGLAEVMPEWKDRTQEQRDNSKYCDGCGEGINKGDFVRLDKWPIDLCLDCGHFAAQDKRSLVPEIDEDVYDQLDTYALIEEQVHRDTMAELRNLTGMDRATIEFMLFRLEDRFVRRNTQVERLQRFLRWMYEETNKVQWKEHLWVDDEDFVPVDTREQLAKTRNLRDQVEQLELEQADKPEKDKPKEAHPAQRDGTMKVFMSCDTHGTVQLPNDWPSSKGCPVCEGAGKEPERGKTSDALGRIELPCVVKDCTHRTLVLRQAEWWVCSPHDVQNGRYYGIKENMSMADKVNVLRKKAEFENPEAEVCPIEAAQGEEEFCYIPTCEGETVGVTPNGFRACHGHLRGVKGAKFDNKRRGILAVLN